MFEKTAQGWQVKDADRGEFVAVIGTYDEVDADADVVRPGAFPEGVPVPVSAYGHASWQGAPPIGTAEIRSSGRYAVAEGRMFMQVPAARDTFAVMKEMGDRQQFSWGYDPVRFSYGEEGGKRVRYLEELKIHEISPVLVGASVGTRLLSAKGSADDELIREYLRYQKLVWLQTLQRYRDALQESLR